MTIKQIRIDEVLTQIQAKGEIYSSSGKLLEDLGDCIKYTSLTGTGFAIDLYGANDSGEVAIVMDSDDDESALVYWASALQVLVLFTDNNDPLYEV